MSCTHCSKPVLDNEQWITCQGFCLSSFHRTCIGLTVEDFICWNRNTLIWWMCCACSKMMNSIRQRESILAEREKYDSEPANYRETDTSVTEVECSQPSMQDVMLEIAGVKQRILEIEGNISAGSKTGHNGIFETSVATQFSPLSSTRLQHGSRLDTSADSNESDGNAERFWIFFTKIKNNVSEKQMLDMVCESLCYSSKITPVVKRLVPYWKDPSTLPYVSFKIGIDPMMKTVALLPSTWPRNICFREFYDHLPVWEPSGQN